MDKADEDWTSFLKEFGKVYELTDTDSLMKLYDQIAAGHAKYMPPISSEIHQMLVDLLFKHVKTDEKLNKDCLILDVCCGSGIMGSCLRKAGFTGTLEGLDGSVGMLTEAGKLKNVYNKLHHEVINSDGIITIPKNHYDIVTIGHAFFPDSLHAYHIDALLELLHCGGLFAFDLNYDLVQISEEMKTYIGKIDDKIAQLIDDGICQRVFESDVDNVFPRLSLVSPPGGSDFMHQRHVCLKKL